MDFKWGLFPLDMREIYIDRLVVRLKTIKYKDNFFCYLSS